MLTLLSSLGNRRGTHVKAVGRRRRIDRSGTRGTATGSDALCTRQRASGMATVPDCDRTDDNICEQQEPVRLPSVPVHQPVDMEEDAEEARREKQMQREEDLRMAMTA